MLRRNSFDQDKVATELVAQLNKMVKRHSGRLMNWMTHSLVLLKKVASSIQSEKLQGFYWMGVIYLTTEGK